MEETWKQVKGYPNYEVSNLGRVKSKKNKCDIVLKQAVSHMGYKYVSLSCCGIVKKHYIHQLVAIQFLGHIPNGYNGIINHIDHNKINNNVYNLEITTQRINACKSHLKHSSIYTGVSWSNTYNKWQANILINKKINFLGYFKNEYDAHISYEKRIIELGGEKAIREACMEMLDVPGRITEDSADEFYGGG